MKDFAFYFDMDGVLADYDAGIRSYGFDIDPSLKREINKSGTDNPLKRECYEAIKGRDFFAKLPILPGSVRMYQSVVQSRPIILTASPKFGATEDNYYENPFWCGAAFHKRFWMEFVFLPKAEPMVWRNPNSGKIVEVREQYRVHIKDERFICTTSARKQEFIHRKKSPHQILIDDREANVKAWAEAGGFGIFHNGDCNQTIRYINQYQQGIFAAGTVAGL